MGLKKTQQIQKKKSMYRWERTRLIHPKSAQKNPCTKVSSSFTETYEYPRSEKSNKSKKFKNFGKKLRKLREKLKKTQQIQKRKSMYRWERTRLIHPKSAQKKSLH